MVTQLSQNLGRIIEYDRGKFVETIAYGELEVVNFRFNFYRVRKNVSPPIGTLPTNTAYWEVLSGSYSEESCLIEKFTISSVANKAFLLDSSIYDKVVLEMNLKLSAASLIFVDTRYGPTSSFPANSSYNDNYVTANNYDDVFFEVVLKDYADPAKLTAALGSGTGFRAGVPFEADTVWVPTTTSQASAINVVALNNATMSGTIFLKKYKYNIG